MEVKCTPAIYVSKAFKWEQDLSRHKQSKHECLRYKCSICSKDFASNRGLRIHKKLVHEQQSILVEYVITKHRRNVKRHMKSVHLNSRTNLCDLCDYVGTRKDLLKSHRSSVHTERMYQCESCDHQASIEAITSWRCTIPL